MKQAVPENVLTQHQARITQHNLSQGLVMAVKKNFPNWRNRTKIYGGEIILQNVDYTDPIEGMMPGIHLTVSLVSFRPERDYYGLAEDLVTLIKQAENAGDFFMTNINVFVQMTLDQAVVKAEDGRHYRADPNGKILLEFGSVETSGEGQGWHFVEM
jgi:hypothetical protein